MSKLLGSTLVLVLAALGVAIASLVFNILIFNQVNTDDSSVGCTTPEQITSTSTIANVDTTVITTTSPSDPSTTAGDTTGQCPTSAEVSTDPKWKEAADRILATADLSVDPCEDFYQFTCGKYIQNTDLQGQSRKGSFDQAQYEINLGLADYFDSLIVNGDTADTEKYQKNFLNLCVADGLKDATDPAVRKQKWKDLSKDLNIELGFPLLGVPAVPADYDDLFATMGIMERLLTGGPFMTSFVTADFKNYKKNAIYINQPALHFARDYFVKPQYISHLQDYAADIRDVILAYKDNMGLTMDKTFCPNDTPLSDIDCAQKVAEWAVSIERNLAMSSWPDTELRNYEQQYTPFSDFASLDSRFPSLSLGKYVRVLTHTRIDDTIDFKIVLSQPSYFAALDGMFSAGHISVNDFVNYLAIHYLLDNSNEIGIDIPSATKKNIKRKEYGLKFDRYITRRGQGASRIRRRPLNSKGLAKNANDAIRTGCIDTLIDYMPYGPGYTYVRNRKDKFDVRDDVKKMTENIITQFSQMIDTLDWMDDESKVRAHAKSANLVRNYLWPDSVFGTDFNDFTTIDNYNLRYTGLGITDKMSYWQAIQELKAGLMATEQWDIVHEDGDRTNFLSSPATVNAWYQPERNSITFPFGILNPPFYDLLFPQAYNYAGQGGTGGHELTHGYDDEGTQFDEFGQLASCEFTHCSILDDSSRSGFVDMAQCVVQQYNSQCCPLKKGNVRCANGDTTQGENIADIGGQQAAYKAYNQFIADQGKPELRLPGLESYTPNQIFWMTYGASWCTKLTDDRLVRQLMTDPHAPASCRVNQVMQDIPQFGQDFKCKRGVAALYPYDDDRCKVWVGF